MFLLDKFFTDAFEIDFVLAGLYSMCKLLVFERVDFFFFLFYYCHIGHETNSFCLLYW